jgi:uncharacterized membrane protein YtjA (UPF0391 family)
MEVREFVDDDCDVVKPRHGPQRKRPDLGRRRRSLTRLVSGTPVAPPQKRAAAQGNRMKRAGITHVAGLRRVIQHGFRNWRQPMFYWAAVFLIIALVAGLFGFAGLAGTAANIAWILFVVGLVLFVAFLVLGRRPRL